MQQKKSLLLTFAMYLEGSVRETRLKISRCCVPLKIWMNGNKSSKGEFVFFYYHHRFYSPRWALACVSNCRQRLLSWAAVNQFLQPNFLASSFTPSIHPDFGWPCPRWPPGFVHNIVLGILIYTVTIKISTKFPVIRPPSKKQYAEVEATECCNNLQVPKLIQFSIVVNTSDLLTLCVHDCVM